MAVETATKKKIAIGVAIGLIVIFVAWLASIVFPQNREWWFDIFGAMGRSITSLWAWLWGGVEIPRVIIGVVVILGLMYVGRGGRLEALQKRLWAFQDELHKRNVELRQKLVDQPRPHRRSNSSPLR
jgi:hypothetical protein